MTTDSTLEITKDDFLESGWKEAVERSKPRVIEYYFSKLAERARGEDDPRKRNVLELLAHVCLTRSATKLEGLATNVDQLSDFDLSFLKEILPDVDDPELQSRIGDVLWIRRRDVRAARTAISAYLSAAAEVEDFEQWVFTLERIERALQLASMLGRNQELYSIVLSRVFDLLSRCNGDDPLYLSAELMRLLLERREGEAKEYAPLCEKLAVRAETESDFHKARRYWQVKVDWHFQDKDEDAARAAKLKVAETYEKESDFNLENRKPPFLMASHPLEQAIVAYRRVGGCEQKVEELKLRLREYQKKGLEEMPLISSGPVDISDLVVNAEKTISGKSFVDTLKTLASLSVPNSYKRTREQVEKQREKYLFMRFFPKTLFNSTGRIIGRQPTEGEEAILADMFQYVQTSYQLSAKGFIEPARHVILFEHPARLIDVFDLVSDHPFIPVGREIIVARGIHAGLTGDFLAALHFLVPQLEESVRYVLIQSGIVPSSFTDKGIQDEFNLNRLLTDSKFTAKLVEIFGEDLIFDFRGLLVERFGANLRNDMAHGLIEHDLFYSYAAIYFWWLSLRFYLLPHLRRNVEDDSRSVNETDNINSG